MAAPELSRSELAFFAALERHKVRYLMVGLTAAALQGAAVVTQDVDLWIENLHDPNFRSALKEVGGAYVPRFHLNPRMLAGGGLDLFDIVHRMDGRGSFADEYQHRLPVQVGGYSIPVLKLERIIASKKATNRNQDRLVLPVLEDALRSQSV